MSHYPIHPEISLAQTLPGAAYVDIDFFMLQRERIFARSWQYLPVVPDNKHNVYPITLLPGLLDVPLLMTQAAEGDWQLLSNVCTHRGAVLVDAATQCRTVRCPYHGRSFGLDGRMLAMPAFEATRDFPAATDHLPRLSLAWSGLLPFVNLDVSLDAKASFAPLGQILDELFAWVPWQDFRFAPELSRDYALAANWMLYVDNYLEGLHIPYVHPALNRALDFKAYVTKPL
ncbi:MAG: choline monooxygenase, partial [Candidatus Melainabacteria bacterium HGW-Melainabacteria-1]